MTTEALLDDVRSKESLRFAWVNEQGFDTSCGWASVASLLQIYWDKAVSEQDLLQELWDSTGLPRSFSMTLADARRLVERAGLDARGFRLDWKALSAAAAQFAPILVHYDKPRPHFALVLGMDAERVVCADPARGLEVISRNEFENRWSGAALFVASQETHRNQARLERAIELALRRTDLLEHAARRL